MSFTASPTEWTTAITDLVLAIECILVALWFAPRGQADRFRAVLWTWVLGLTATAALLGTFAHAFDWPDTTLDRIWMPLNLSLGLVVALFLVGAILDWRGPALASRLIPWAVAIGMAFFAVIEFLDGSFLIFVAYEAVAMLTALAIYLWLACTRRLRGAGIIALAIVLNLIAAGVQASDLSLTIGVPFDHNGLFHIIQIIAVALLGFGLRAGFDGGQET